MKQILLSCIFLLPIYVFTQNGGIANYWHFGYNAGIHFNNPAPTAFTSALSTTEGASSVSDAAGNLLFYTDGITVYNANNLQMPNGFGLWGDYSSTQSAVIVPNPGNTDAYYIFTAAAQAGYLGGYTGIAYSTVDMTLNGGLGEVTTKNVPLIVPACEKLTAARHCNQTDYWLLCHEWDSDAFYAYQVSSTGISAPVISHVGSVHQTAANGIGQNAESLGYLKISPNGKRLVSPIWGVPNNDIEVFDFDNTTGLISNPVYISSPGWAYGASFSPNSNVLYISYIDGLGNAQNGIYQYDLTAPNIAASSVSLGLLQPFSVPGALQLAPDGKIYTATDWSAYLGCINNPNVVGLACNFVDTAVHLSPNFSSIGLPNFPDNLLTAPSFSLGPDLNLCGNGIWLTAGAGWADYLWGTGDTTAAIWVNQAGIYAVQVSDFCGNVLNDTLQVFGNITGFSIGGDTSLCNGGTLTLDAGGGGTYLWSTGATTQSITAAISGMYWVEKTIPCGSPRDTILINISPPIIPTLASTQDFCGGSDALLSLTTLGGNGGFSYSLNGGLFQNSDSFWVGTGTYSVLVQDAYNCTGMSNSLNIIIPDTLAGNLNAGTILCQGDIVALTCAVNGGTAPLQYSLNGGIFQNGNSFNVAAGMYNVTIQDSHNCLFTTHVLSLTEPPLLTGSLSANAIACFGETTTLVVTATPGTAPFQYSLNGGVFQNGNTFNVAAGTYSLTLQDAHNCTFTTNPLVISQPAPLTATTNAPPILCHDGTTNLNISVIGGTNPFQYAVNAMPFQSNSSFSLTAGSYVFTVQDANGCTFTTPNASFSNPPMLNVSASATTLCYNATTTLTALATGGTGAKQYSLDGNAYQNSPYFVVGAGTYTVFAKDNHNCIATTALELAESLPINVQVLQIDSAYCAGGNGQAIVVATGGNGGFSYTWLSNPTQYGDTLRDANKGVHTLKVADSKGCSQKISLEIPYISPPIANYISRPDQHFVSIEEGENIQFFPNTEGVYAYSWDFGNGGMSAAQQPIYAFEVAGSYPVTLTVWDKYGDCSDAYTLLYTIASTCSNLYIPDAFSPNGDGNNDIFSFVGTPLSFEATIFDRWGREIRQFRSITDTWDGKNAPEGVYTYRLKAICKDAKTLDRAGTITLMR